MGKKCGCGLSGVGFKDMPLPSVKTLVSRLGITKAQAEAWRAKAHVADNHPRIDAALELMNKFLGASGVEAIRGSGAHVDRYYYDIVALYVNTGDTYSMTLLYDTDKDKFEVTSWGGWVEAMEASRRYRFE